MCPAMLMVWRPTLPSPPFWRCLAGSLCWVAAVALVVGCRTAGPVLVAAFRAVVVPPASPTHEIRRGGRSGNKSNGSPNPFPQKEEHREGLRRPVAAVVVFSVGRSEEHTS